MEIKFIVPSYNRAVKCITQKRYPFVNILCMESEFDNYKKAENKNIITCPDSVQGNISRVRNWILDNHLKQDNIIVILDDDISYIGYWYDAVKRKLSGEKLISYTEQLAQLTIDSGLYMFGLNCVSDKGAYREYTPFGYLQFIGCPFVGHIFGSELRYDENIPLKEDYDMTLQHIQKYGGCLRANMMHYEAKQSEQIGGCATYRTIENEKKQFDYLQKKWGSEVVSYDRGSKKIFDFNPILRVPIKGV